MPVCMLPAISAALTSESPAARSAASLRGVPARGRRVRPAYRNMTSDCQTDLKYISFSRSPPAGYIIGN